MNGIWSDYLKKEEVEFTKQCFCELEKDTNWNCFLNRPEINRTKNIRPNKGRKEDDLIAMKSSMFEIRIAYLIHQFGLKAEYEFNPNGKNKKTIDFRVYGKKINNINLLIELSSLRESKRQKDKTWKNDVFFGCCLNADEEVSEYFKAQKVLVEKADKFPSEIIQDQFNIIILDMRSSILEGSDCYDYHSILFGSKGLPDALQRVTKGEKLFPGIFCQTHPGNNDKNVIHLRQSIHYFGFVVEKDYKQDELSTKIRWFENPNLSASDSVILKQMLNGGDG